MGQRPKLDKHSVMRTSKNNNQLFELDLNKGLFLKGLEVQYDYVSNVFLN